MTEESLENKNSNNAESREEIFSKSVRAGKRTYFFDVKSTKGNDYYLTITESKKRFGEDGKFFYEKHKVFLYKEDFEKFSEGLNEAVAHIKANAPAIVETERTEHYAEKSTSENSFSDVKFEDLEDKH
ncbi:MAG: DUF3276 family protein [Bacteroidia bacterium]